MARLLALLTLVLLTLCVEPGLAFAQTEEDLEEAGALVEAADAAASSGDDAVALTLYEDAYRLNHDPELLYKVGVSAQRAGDNDRATESFTRYLADAEDGDNRDEAEERLEAIAEAETSEPPPDLNVGEGDGDGSTDSATDPSSSEPGFLDTVPMLSYVLAGAGVALLGLGIVFALVADGNYDAIQNDCTALTDMGAANCNELVDERWGGEVFIFDALAWTSWVLAASAFAAGVYFYLDANKDEPGEEVAIGLTPAGLFARWTF